MFSGGFRMIAGMRRRSSPSCSSLDWTELGESSGPMHLNLGGRVVDFSPDLPMFVRQIRKKFVKVFENIEEDAAKRNTTSTAIIDTNSENHEDNDENMDNNSLDEMASSPQSSVTPSVSRPFLETASSPMASLLPNNYITVNVDSEVGYSYSFSADLAMLPHSSCSAPNRSTEEILLSSRLTGRIRTVPCILSRRY